MAALFSLCRDVAADFLLTTFPREERYRKWTSSSSALLFPRLLTGAAAAAAAGHHRCD